MDDLADIVCGCMNGHLWSVPGYHEADGFVPAGGEVPECPECGLPDVD